MRISGKAGSEIKKQLKAVLLGGAALMMMPAAISQAVSYEYDAFGRVVAVKYYGSDTAVQPRPALPTNSPTVINNPIADTTVDEGEMVDIDLSTVFSDPDDPLTFSMSGEPAGISLNGSSLSGGPTETGTFTIVVSASDGDPSTVDPEDQFVLTVNVPAPPNQPPTTSGSVGTKTYLTGASINIATAQIFTDPEGQALTYLASNLPTGAFISASTGLITGSTNVVGTRNITVTALDPEGASAATSFSLVINQANRAPTLTTPLPDRSVFVGQVSTLALTSYFGDPDSDPLSFSFSGAHTGVTIVNGSTLRMAPSSVAGAASITVVASDGALTKSDAFNFTVPNRAPNVTGSLPARTYETSQGVNIPTAQVFSDPDGQALTYAASNLPSGLSINAGNGVITGSTMTVGARTITVTARDPYNATATRTFTLTINQANRAPVMSSPIPNQTVTIGTSESINLSTWFSDPDGDSLSYSVNGQPSSAGVSLSGSTLTMAPTGQPADYNITVTASDGSLTRSDTFILTAAPDFGNCPPFTIC